MTKTILLILGIPACFTLLVAWFAWSTLQATPPVAAATLRSAGLSSAAAIEQLAATDSSLRSLARYLTPEIAYFALVDPNGTIRFHTNPALIETLSGTVWEDPLPAGELDERRERLGTGEEVYLLRTRIHPQGSDYLLVLAQHTYRADEVIRRARAGVGIVAALSVALWGLTGGLFLLLRREERHRRAMRRREELARLGEMGALMAHEIRNPLASIKGFAQLLATSHDLELRRRHAGKIVTQSLRLEALVNDLLTFAREERGERSPTDLAKLIEECVDLIREEAAAQGVAVEIAANSPLPAPVVADRIVQLLLNLLKNALQAMPQGGLLKVSLQQSGRSALIRVSDSGEGIAPQELARVFEPFWTSRASGTGLGLALCRKVAEEHGGELTLASEPGHGTVCTLTLPLRA